VPAAVVALIAAGAGVSTTVANADPALPSRTAADLLVSLAQAPGHAFSGIVAENADLGIPALPGAASTSLSWQSLITGSHTARVWYASPAQVRLSLVADLAESDVVRNGRDVWVWSSRDNTASHSLLPSGSAALPQSVPSIDPQAMAIRALAAIDPTTSVTVDGTSRVAGRPVYELVLAPRDSSSLVGQIRLGIDSETSLPMRVQVIARGASTPAFETAFTSISFATPDSSVFAFSPPAGAQVSESALPTDALTGRRGPGTGSAPTGAHPTVIGTGWTAVVELPRSVTPTAGGPSTAGSAATAALMQATTTVTGTFGSAQLLQTSLVSVLLLPDGRTLVGAVTPERLEQVAAGLPR
jgi:outer membrane lipoprotein-sorting protein